MTLIDYNEVSKLGEGNGEIGSREVSDIGCCWGRGRYSCSRTPTAAPCTRPFLHRSQHAKSVFVGIWYGFTLMHCVWKAGNLLNNNSSRGNPATGAKKTILSRLASDDMT